MRLLKVILLLVCVLSLPGLGFSAGLVARHSASTAEQAEAEHGISQKAGDIGSLFGLPISNSMLVTWGVAIALIIFAQIATRNMKQVPEGAQNFWEWMVESLHDFLSGIIGDHLVKRTFWFFATIFIFILFCNWFGLIPGFGSIGLGHNVGGKFVITNPVLRGANADLNMTLAMALIFFACWIYWALREVGPIGFLGHLFAPPKGEMKGFLKLLMMV